MEEGEGEIYSATYSNVPVYELKITGDHVMRRRSDDWINATHILKFAGFDKPARTRLLEREVQKGVHEKIQGGYGKYQGTWVPLTDGRALAEKNGILRKLRKIFDYVPGDRSPPPAPKHTTAASNRPKAAKPLAQPRRPQQMMPPPANGMRQPVHAHPPADHPGYYRPVEQYDNTSAQFNDDESQEDVTPESASFFGGDEDMLPASQPSTGPRKRGRLDTGYSAVDMEHTMFGDELLDYFVSAGDELATNISPPIPPANFEINRAIDNQGNNALHWACAMGDLGVTKDLLSRGASPAAGNEYSGETPLMRTVLFTNNYDKQTFPRMVTILQHTITERDFHGATVFHHVAETARSKSKWSCCRFYAEILINKLNEMGPNLAYTTLIAVDSQHDTAVLRAIRNNCIKLATMLLNQCSEAGEIANLRGETANEHFISLAQKRNSLAQLPSSPLRPGETYTGKRNSTNKRKRTGSRAASTVLQKAGPLIEEASTRLASMWDNEMKEKDASVAEVVQNLKDFEEQRHKIRQETFALMAKGEVESDLPNLRQQYDACLQENESLLERKEHEILQSEVLTKDQQVPNQSFRSANNIPLTLIEMRELLPWALELYRHQVKRKALVKDVAKLIADAGTGENIGKHRKLVSVAVGLREEELDGMAAEILESLDVTTQVAVVGGGPGPLTPPHQGMDLD